MLNIATSYEERAAVLKELGFDSYKEYLKSYLWCKIRRMCFGIKGRSCYLCSKQATCMHHNSYDLDTLIGKSVRRIVPLCLSCHEKIEFDSADNKLGVKDACERYLLLRSARVGCDICVENFYALFGPDTRGKCVIYETLKGSGQLKSKAS